MSHSRIWTNGQFSQWKSERETTKDDKINGNKEKLERRVENEERKKERERERERDKIR